MRRSSRSTGQLLSTTASISWGRPNTNVYLGSLQPAGKPDWTSNRSTLSRLGGLFEHVDDEAFFKNHWQQVGAEFYEADGQPEHTGIKAVVVSEAAAAGKSGIVNQFMASVTLNGKGGGTIFPQSGRLVPRRTDSSAGSSCRSASVVVPRYVTTIKTLSAATSSTTSSSLQRGHGRAVAGPDLPQLEAMQNAAYDKLMGEPYRLAIKEGDRNVA